MITDLDVNSSSEFMKICVKDVHEGPTKASKIKQH